MRTNVEVVLVRAIYVCCMSCGRYARAGAISSSVARVSSMFGGRVSIRALQRSFGRTSELATKA